LISLVGASSKTLNNVNPLAVILKNSQHSAEDFAFKRLLKFNKFKVDVASVGLLSNRKNSGKYLLVITPTRAKRGKIIREL
jgi:hypothetical protein